MGGGGGGNSQGSKPVTMTDWQLKQRSLVIRGDKRTDMLDPEEATLEWIVGFNLFCDWLIVDILQPSR